MVSCSQTKKNGVDDADWLRWEEEEEGVDWIWDGRVMCCLSFVCRPVLSKARPLFFFFAMQSWTQVFFVVCVELKRKETRCRHEEEEAEEEPIWGPYARDYSYLRSQSFRTCKKKGREEKQKKEKERKKRQPLTSHVS